MHPFFKLLKEHQIIRELMSVNFLCYFGAWFVHTAIYTLLIELNAPVWAITITAALTFFPGVIFAPLTGVIVDSFAPKKLLVSMFIIEIVTIFLLLFIDSLAWMWFLFFILFIRMSAATVSFQAGMSIFPKLFKGNELKISNELNSLVWTIAYTSGMAIAGLFVHFFGVQVSILMSLVLFIAGLFITLKIDIPDFIQKGSLKILSGMKDGLMYLKKNRRIMHLIFLHASVGITSYDALVALLVKFNYPLILSIPLAIGLIDGVRSLGLFLGTTFLGKYVNKNTLIYFFIAQGVGLFIWAFLQFNFYFGLFGTFCAGFVTTILWSFTYTILQEETDEKYYGRVIAYNDMVFLSCSTIISLVIGFLYNRGFDTFAITLLLGCGFFLFGVYYLWIQRHYFSEQK